MDTQFLIDMATSEVIADYQANNIRSHAIALHADGVRVTRVPIESGKKLLDFECTAKTARQWSESVAASHHMAFHHLKDQGVEGILVTVADHNEREMVGFVVNGKNGAKSDLALVIELGQFNLGEPSEWNGQKIAIHLDFVDYGNA